MSHAYEIPGTRITLTPNADFSDKRYTAVKPDASAGMVACPAGEMAVGILQTPGIAGEPCAVMVTGVTLVTFGDTVAVGDAVEVGTDGKVIKANTGKIIGVCLVGGAADQLGTICLK